MGTLLCSGLSSEGEGRSPSSEERGVVGTLLCSGLSSEGDGLSPSSEEKGVVGREELAIERALWTVVRSGMALGRLQYVQALYRTYCTMCSVPELWSFWRGLGRTYCRTCSVDRGPVWHGLRQSSVCASPGQHLQWNLLWGLWSCLASP